MSSKCIQDILAKARRLNIDFSERDAAAMFRQIRNVKARYDAMINDPQAFLSETEPENPAPGALYGEDLRRRILNMSPEDRLTEYGKIAFEQTLTDKEEALRRQYLQVQRTAAIENQVRTAPAKTRIGALNEITFAVNGRRRGIADIQTAEISAALDKYLKKLGPPFGKEDKLNILRETLKPGSTGDENAAELARVWLKTTEEMRQQANKAGAHIGKLDDWGLPQIWADGYEMKKRGLSMADKARLLNPLTSYTERSTLFDKARTSFVNDAMDRIDRSKYWNDATGQYLNDQEMKGVLGKAWDTIVTDGMNKPSETTYGRGGMAGRISDHRALHFKDAEGLYDMLDKYGRTDLGTTMLMTIRRQAHQIAMMETFGPNPDSGFRSGLDLARHIDGTDLNIADKMPTRSDWANLYYNELKGLNYARGNNFMVRAMDGVRNMLIAAKLGAALLSHPTHIGTLAALARTDGLGAGETLMTALKSLNPLNEADRALARQHSILANSVMNDISLQLGELSKTARVSRALANMTIKLGGMEWWINAMKRAYQLSIGFHLNDAVQSGKDIGAFDSHFKGLLDRYGITDKDWNIIRQAKSVDIYGEPTITPMTIKALGDSPEIREAAIKVATMMNSEADTAVPTPGIKEMALIHGGTKPNTIGGQLVKSFALFKTFNIALLSRLTPRIWHSGGTPAFGAGLMAQYALSMAILGGLSVQLKEIEKGRNPRDMTDWKFWPAAIAQGTGLGIFGDFVYGNQNRFGGGPMATLGGPIGSLIEDTGKLTLGNLRRYYAGQDTKTGAEAIQFAKNYTPLPINLWYTRAALDHMLFFKLQEAANPGYLNRMERRVRTQNDQDFWWRPQDTLPGAVPDVTRAIGNTP